MYGPWTSCCHCKLQGNQVSHYQEVCNSSLEIVKKISHMSLNSFFRNPDFLIPLGGTGMNNL